MSDVSMGWGDEEEAGLMGVRKESVLVGVYYRLHVGGNRELAG